MFRLFRQYAEHIGLANSLRFRVLVGGFQRIAQRVHQRRAMRTETIERPGHNQFFQHPAVELFNIGPRAEVEQLAEITAIVARLNDRFDRPFANAFDGADAVDNLAVVVNVEMVQAGVNIRGQNFQPHAPALVHQANDLLGVVHIGGHYRRHKLSRIVCLKPQRLVGDQRVGGGVRLVKSVTGEFLHQVEDFHRQFAVNAVFLRPIFKDRTLLGHLLRFFLTHRTAQHIRAAEGITGEHLGNLHDLFLIQDNAVGRLQHRFQALMLPLHVRVGNLFAAVLTVDKVIYHPRLQRTRAEQGHQRDHIFEAVRLQTLNQIFHAARFKLEDRGGFRALQHVEAFLVIQRDSGDIQRPFAVFRPPLVDHLQRPVNDSERTQTEEVEFYQPGVFHVVFVKLGNRMQPLLIAIQRRKVGNFSGSDNHPTGVFTGVSRHPFQLTRHVDQRFNFFVRLIDFRQLRFGFKRFRQRHTRIGRHQLGDTVDKAVRVTQHAAHIADDRFRRHGTEGDDLRYRIAAIHVRHVLNNLVAFLHAEIDVEVGHRDTFRVKETFEQQVEFQRIKIGDLQRVGHQRAGAGTAARANRHAVILRPLDKLHDDQEVAREPHLVDNLQFNIQTLVILRALFSTDGRIREEKFQPLFQTLFRFHDQEIFRGHIAGRELRQEIFAKPHGDVAAFGDLDAVLQRFRDIGEQLAHLLLTAHILLRRVVARPFRVVERKAVVDRDADFMGVEIAGVEKADIVGRHHRQAARFRQRHGGVEIGLFILTTGADQLKKITVREMLFIERDALFH